MPAASPTAAKEKSNSVSPLVAAFAFAENSCLDFQLSGAPRIGESSSLSSTSRWACSYYTYETASALSVATYYRDSTTGLDYAQNRYYASTLGRFISPDPYKSGVGSGDPAHPQTWNRYAYVVGDPINGYDPTGKDCELVDNGSGNFVLNCASRPWVRRRRRLRRVAPATRGEPSRIYTSADRCSRDCGEE
jgi:RHS repeat-associated protein